MPVDPEQLAAELAADPLGLKYADRVKAGDDAGLAAMLNAPAYPGTRETFVTDRTLAAALGPFEAAGIIVGLRMVAEPETNPGTDLPKLVEREAFASFVRRLQGSGIDVGNAVTRATIDQIGQMPPLAKIGEHADAIKALADVLVSRAEVLWGRGASVSVSDVSFALRGDR